MDRTQLFDTLSNLPPAAFERLLIAVNMPRMNRAGAAATIGEQVSALLAWAESPIGPGVEAIARHLAELNHFEFDAYLRSLIATYEKWWEYYTLTDAVGRVEQPAPEKPSVFDFGLMVQTVAKETDGPGSDPRAEEQEETERLPVLEGIRKYADDHVLLVGRPGSGKSTALIRLLLEEATQTLQQSEGQVPVLIELRYWNTSIEGLIQGFLQRHGLTLDDATLSTLLGQGRFLLLVDGLNELPSESERTELSAFRRNHPKVPMIFTTRDLGLGGDLGIEKKLEMQPLTEAQMKAFIRAYVPSQAEAMLRQLSDRLREFGQTPLLLWMLCEVFQRSPNRQMPTNLAEVFRAFTTMYGDSSVRKHEVALLKGDVRPLSDRRLWKEALKALAALMMQGETPVDVRVAIHRTEAERELGKLFAKERFPVRDILDDLLKYHLLQNRTTDQLEFRHQLIQEYYAAEHLLQLLLELTDEQLKRHYLNYLKWTEPIALMLALVSDEAQALRVVKLAMDNIDLMLGSRLAGKVRSTLQPTTIGCIDALQIPIALKVLCWAVSLSKAAVPSFLQALEHPDSDIRSSTAYALGEVGGEVTVPGLLQALEDPDPYVRRRSAEALGKVAGEKAVPDLLQALEDPDPDVRSSAAEALGKVGGEVAVPGLLQALEDPGPYVRSSAAEALGKVGGEEAVQGLLQALEHSDSDVRWSAADALGKVGSEVAVPGLQQALKDPDSDVRMRAAFALKKVGGEAAVPGLLQALEHPDSDVRRSAADALGGIGGEAAVLGLLQALKDPDSDVRSSAAEALGKIGSEAAVPSLLQALEDPEYFVYKSAVFALFRVSGKAAVPVLLQALEHPDSDVRRRAAKALEEVGSEAAVPGLLQALEDPDFNVRRSAFEALGKVGGEAAVPGLLQVLKHPNFDVRSSAAKALEKVGSEAAIPGLLRALEDPDPEVRSSAAKALGKVGGEAAVPGLLRALKDRNPYLRRIVAYALEEVGGEAAVPDLLQALEHSDDLVRRIVANALGKIGGEATLTNLWQLHRRQPDIYLKGVISTVQNRCKFYNYEIWQACLTDQQGDSNPSQSDKTIANTITIQTVEKLTIMSDKAPIFNQQNATIGVNYAAEGSQQDFTQHIHALEQNFEILLTGYKQDLIGN